MKVIGEMEDVLIQLSSNEKVCQFIDIVVADIPKAYGLVLSRDWSVKLNGYFASDWSHLWFPVIANFNTPSESHLYGFP